MEGPYLNFLLEQNLPNINPVALLSLLFLALARLFPIIAQAPFFGARVLPHPVKVIMGVVLFVIMLPHLLLVTSTPLSFDAKLLLLFMKELFVGYALGMLVSIPFTIMRSAGMFIDHQRGGASLMVQDPTTQNQSSPIGLLYNQLLVFLFFVMNGPFHFIDAIVTSYQIIPPDGLFAHQFFSSNSPFWGIQIQLFNNMMRLTVQLAGPALIAVLMTDVFLGIANRLAPQVQITFLGLPLKSLLAMTVVCLGLTLFLKEATGETAKWLEVINESIAWMSWGKEAA